MSENNADNILAVDIIFLLLKYNGVFYTLERSRVRENFFYSLLWVEELDCNGAYCSNTVFNFFGMGFLVAYVEGTPSKFNAFLRYNFADVLNLNLLASDVSRILLYKPITTFYHSYRKMQRCRVIRRNPLNSMTPAP